MTNQAIATSARPTARGERNTVLDVLRGFSLLGILMVNFEFFAMPSVLHPGYKAAIFPGALDRFASWAMQFACDGKFILIFSFLWGYGLHAQMTRAQNRGESAWPTYARRLWGLLFLGALHATFLFVGDILVLYALLGWGLWRCRDWTPRRLLGGAAVCWALSLVGHLVIAWAASRWVDSASSLDATRVVEIYRAGSFFEITAQRVREWGINILATPFLFAPQVFSLFLTGLAAAKSGLLRDLTAESAFWKRIFWTCLPFALIGNAAYATLLASPDAVNVNGSTFTLAMIGRAIFPPLGAACYVAGWALLLRRECWQRRTELLAGEGRMSLSNYLGESLVNGFLFLSFGLGLFGSIGPAKGAMLMFLVWGAQLVWSDWWLSRFGIGPAEWLLRSWTYGAPQPLQRAGRGGAEAI